MSHSDVRIEQLCAVLGIKLNLLYSVSGNKKRLLDEITKHGFRFFFFNMHIFGRVFESHENAVNEIGEFGLLRDFFSELQNELLHSIVMSALGWPKYAIYTLRRCLELGFTAAFVVTSRHNYPEDGPNPFLNMFEQDLLPNLFYKPSIRTSDLKKFENTEKENGRSNRQAEVYVRENFTEIYLNEYQNIYCTRHTPEYISSILSYEIPPDFQFPCKTEGCEQRGKFVAFEKVPSLDLIQYLAESRLIDRYGRNGINIKGLYDELCAYLHPNLRGHQHSQEFKLKDLKFYLSMLDKTISDLSWLLRGSIFLLGLIPQNEFEFHDIDIISTHLVELKKSLCFLVDGKCRYTGKWG